MNRPARLVSFLPFGPAFTRTSMRFGLLGLAGIITTNIFGCQLVGGLDELTIAVGSNDGGAGSGGSGGSANSSSSSSSSSSGVPIMGDIACGGAICPVGTESACCHDHYHTNDVPYLECVTGPPGNDACNTTFGAKGYETRIECQFPAHCPPGTVCCGNVETVEVITWYTALTCRATCTWPDTVICDPLDPNSVCPMVNNGGNMVQTMCGTSEFLPPEYAACK